MCTNGVNTSQFESMIDMADDYVAVGYRWTHKMAHMAEDRAAILGALDAMADVSAQMAQLFIREGGITGCFLPVQGGERERFTVEEYLEWIAPAI